MTNSIGLKMVLIQPGEFMMGSTEGGEDTVPVHRVKLTDPFYMGATEVTEAQWQAVMGPLPKRSRGADHPVASVSWHQCVAFCRELTEREREEGLLPEGTIYSLPTEAEWEYACRAGSTTEYCFGDDPAQLDEYAWYGGNSGGVHPVATKKPNAWGLYDMHGNVREWCMDRYGKYGAEDAVDPTGPATGHERVGRGSCACRGDTAPGSRSAFRYGKTPHYYSGVGGFRIVRKKGAKMAVHSARDESSNVIHGLEGLDWGGGPLTRQVSGITVLTAALQAADCHLDYVDVMGMSGAAFKLTMYRDWCPSAACFELDNSVTSLFGLKREVFHMNEQKNPNAKQRMRETLVASIDRGMPVPYCDGEHSLVVGYRDNGTTFVCMPYAGGSGKCSEFAMPRGMLGDAWFFDVLTKTGEPDLKAVMRKSWRRAVELARTKEEDQGLNAYGLWARTLRNPPEKKLNLHAYAYCYVILLSSRDAAGQYLRRLAHIFPRPIDLHLLAAADRYGSIGGRLRENMACVMARWGDWESKWTPENRETVAAALDACLQDERLAIAEIEKALQAIEAE